MWIHAKCQINVILIQTQSKDSNFLKENFNFLSIILTESSQYQLPKSICISSCKIFINLHIQDLFFLFYILILTKHPHQFIYSTHLFNKIFIFSPFSSLSQNQDIPHSHHQTTRSNPQIKQRDRWWSTVMDWTHWSMVKHCEAWQRDRTHLSNNEIDGEALWSLIERSNPLIKQRDRRWS